MNRVYECIEHRAVDTPEYKAVIEGATGKCCSYSQLNARVNSLAHALRSLGVEKGDRIGIYLPNSSAFIIAFLAIAKVGAISVPINIMFKELELEYILNNSGAKGLIGEGDSILEQICPILPELPWLERVITVGSPSKRIKNPKIVAFNDLLKQYPTEFPPANVEPGDPVSLLYTSGTTGQPKGALASHLNWSAMAVLSAREIVPIRTHDVVLSGYPYFHVALVIAVLPTLYAGGTVLTLNRFFPGEALSLMTRHKVTHFMGSPTMWAYLIDEYEKNRTLYDITSLRTGQSAGAPLPVELRERIEEVFSLTLIECYGATECSSTVTYTRKDRFVPGSVGLPAQGWKIRITDECAKELPHGQIGELWCKGPGVISAYWRAPELTEARIKEGWWRSGDLAYIGREGFQHGQLFLAGRKDDMIICGGYNIYPAEVEAYLARHPKVISAVVIGMPDPVKGQIPKAYIVLNAGEGCTETEIIDFCKEGLAAYKAPRLVEFVSMPDLPLSASGKVLRRKLREMEGLSRGRQAGFE